MERIQKAIDKAKRERSGDIGRNVSDSPTVKTNNLVSKATRVNTDSIIYNKSRLLTFTDAELKSKLIIAGFAHDSRSEPYRQLRSQVLRIMRENNWQSIAITSPKPLNGKTLTAINLAISMSQELNQTVLLADLDLRNPTIAATFGLTDITHGIVESAMGSAALEDILFNPGYERLVIAPGIAQGHQTSEILSSPKMMSLHQELKQRYEDRLIIFDLPALLCSDDALVLTPSVDAVLLVIEDGGSSKAEIQQCMRLLEHTNILGIVVNKLYS